MRPIHMLTGCYLYHFGARAYLAVHNRFTRPVGLRAKPSYLNGLSNVYYVKTYFPQGPTFSLSLNWRAELLRS